MDNHNHAFAFWCYWLQKGFIKPGAELFHVDQHKDMRVPDAWISLEECMDGEAVERYVDEVLNVGTFIQPALKNGLLSKVHMLQGERDFEQVWQISPGDILDIDLDILAPHMEYMGVEKVVEATRGLIDQATYITVATSPLFIEHELAISILKKMFHHQL